MNTLRLSIVIVGALLLVAGVFSPVLEIFVLGSSQSFTYFDKQPIQSGILFVIALFTIFMVWIKKYRWLWLSPVILILVFFWSFYSYSLEIQGFKNKVKEGLFFIESDSINDMLMETVRFQWGVFLLLIGAILINVAALWYYGDSKKVN